MNNAGFGVCPYCKEKVRITANKCRYCYSDLTEDIELYKDKAPNRLVPLKTSSTKNTRNFWWMKGLAAIVVLLVLMLVGLSINKISDQKKEEEVAVKKPTVVNTGHEIIDTWVNASNFLTSKQGGLYTLHGEFLGVLSASDTFQDLSSIEAKANELKIIDPPPVLQDLFIKYLVGIDLIVDSANYAKQGDWDMATPTLNKGLDLSSESLEKMYERVMEELEKALKED